MFCILATLLMSVTSQADDDQGINLTRNVQNSLGSLVRCSLPLVAPGVGIAVLSARELNVWLTERKIKRNYINPLLISATQKSLEDKNFDLETLPEMQNLEEIFKKQSHKEKCREKQEQLMADLVEYIHFFISQSRVSEGL